MVTWWLHGGYMTVHGGYMVVTWWLHGGYTVVTPADAAAQARPSLDRRAAPCGWIRCCSPKNRRPGRLAARPPLDPRHDLRTGRAARVDQSRGGGGSRACRRRSRRLRRACWRVPKGTNIGKVQNSGHEAGDRGRSVPSWKEVPPSKSISGDAGVMPCSARRPARAREAPVAEKSAAHRGSAQLQYLSRPQDSSAAGRRPYGMAWHGVERACCVIWGRSCSPHAAVDWKDGLK